MNSTTFSASYLMLGVGEGCGEGTGLGLGRRDIGGFLALDSVREKKMRIVKRMERNI